VSLTSGVEDIGFVIITNDDLDDNHSAWGRTGQTSFHFDHYSHSIRQEKSSLLQKTKHSPSKKNDSPQLLAAVKRHENCKRSSEHQDNKMASFSPPQQQGPDIHLYTTQTPNGIKISILLEELGYVALSPPTFLYFTFLSFSCSPHFVCWLHSSFFSLLFFFPSSERRQIQAFVAARVVRDRGREDRWQWKRMRCLDSIRWGYRGH